MDHKTNKQTHSRYAAARRLLIFWTLFIGLGAVAGASGMLIDPTGKAMGMDAMLPYFQVLPFADVLFQDFVFSGVALLIVNGLTNLTAAALLLRKKSLGVTLGGVFGVTLMLWICIQFYMFPLNFMSTAYFFFGLAQAATGYAAGVFAKQEAFVVRPEEYPHVGTNEGHLVVYFSRMGYGKKLAYELAEQTGAELFEICSTERTEGTAGFWWCGTPCTAGICLSVLSPMIWKNMTGLLFAPPSGSLPLPVRCGLSAGRRRAGCGRRTTFWSTTLPPFMKMPPGRWTSFCN